MKKKRSKGDWCLVRATAWRSCSGAGNISPQQSGVACIYDGNKANDTSYRNERAQIPGRGGGAMIRSERGRAPKGQEKIKRNTESIERKTKKREEESKIEEKIGDGRATNADGMKIVVTRKQPYQKLQGYEKFR